jgi:hypothetical protein
VYLQLVFMFGDTISAFLLTSQVLDKLCYTTVSPAYFAPLSSPSSLLSV